MSTSTKTIRQLDTPLPDPKEGFYERRFARILTDISPRDTMYEGNLEHYNSVGRSAFRCIRQAMLRGGKSGFLRILDFGSGYGRVMRVLQCAFPRAQLVACDVDRGAVEFCSKTFSAEPLVSNPDPERSPIKGSFDLIWCGTLFTQFDRGDFSAFLRLLHSHLSPGGLLVFTTHGEFVADRLRTREYTYGLDVAGIPGMIEDYDATGFGYLDYPQEVRAHVGIEKYGVSISSAGWILRQIEAMPELRFLSHMERAWDNHQDSVACIRRGASEK